MIYQLKSCDFTFVFLLHTSYDGEIVDNYEIDDATHIVKLNQDADHVKNSNKNTVYVNIDDLWKSIKMRTKLDTI
jgi:hypothetical protein